MDRKKLPARLLADGQILAPAPAPSTASSRKIVQPDSLPGIVLDDDQAEYQGSWPASNRQPSPIGASYRHDGNTDRGKKSATFAATIPDAGDYEIRLLFTWHENRSSRTKVTVTGVGEEKTIRINQREPAMKDRVPNALGIFRFEAGAKARVTVSNEGADGYVIVDGLQILPVEKVDLFEAGKDGCAAKGMVAAAILVEPATSAQEVTPRDRFLLLDSRIVEKMENAKLAVGKVAKHERNPLFREDKPWEARFGNLYANVIYDAEEKLFKCWYFSWIRDAGPVPPLEEREKIPYRPRGREEGVCYAVSKNGLEWKKPEQGLIEFDGSKANNLVLRGPHGAGVFKDLREEDPARRYKMIARELSRTEGGMGVRFSADGKHWSELALCPEMKGSRGDSHNNAFWAPELGKYVGIARLRVEPWQRAVGRTESADFLNWTEAVEVLRGNQEAQVYSMPVFHSAGVYLGLPAIYHEHLHGHGGNDRTHTELAWSPDTVTWHRIDPGTPLIPNAETDGHYDWGCVYAADQPMVVDGKIRIYYGAGDGRHGGWRKGFFCLATLGLDRWAGYEQASEKTPAIIVSKPLPYAGQEIRITADVREGGSVQVTLLSSKGEELAKARPVMKTVTDGTLALPKSFHAKDLKEVRLKFEVRKARVYSFSLET